MVIDPNVFVAAAVTNGVSARLPDLWFEARPFEILVCPMLIDELGDVLNREKFRRWLTVDDAAPLVSKTGRRPCRDGYVAPDVTLIIRGYSAGASNSSRGVAGASCCGRAR